MSDSSDPTNSGPYEGKTLSTRTFTITERLLDDHYRGLDLQPSQSGLIPSTLASEPDNGYFTEIAYPYQKGHLWLRQQVRLHKPMKEGASYIVNGHIKEIYRKRNRNVVHYEIAVSEADGSISIHSNHHQSFLAEELEGESVAFRKPNEKPGARQFRIPEGQEFGGLTKTITREMCGIYFHGDANYHTNQESAQQLGFTDVVVGGRMTMAYAARVLEDFFGESWWNGGEMDLKFTNPVWCDDELRIRGVVTGPHATRQEALDCFVWIEKHDGTIALIAEASVLA